MRAAEQLDENYYEQDPSRLAAAGCTNVGRSTIDFPWHVRTLELFAKTLSASRLRPFLIKDSLLRVFDGSATLDRGWGSAAELASVRRALVAFGRGIDNNKHLTAFGRLMLKKSAEAGLKTRRRCIEFYSANAEFIERSGRVARPLIITGMPRTGTTLLHRLVALDPQTRSPYAFELEFPLPPLRRGQDPLADGRIGRSRASLRLIAWLAPGYLEKFAESHLTSPVEHEESLTAVFAQHGLGLLAAPPAGRDYLDRLLEVETGRVPLRYEHRLLRLMDAYSPAPNHWTMKSPAYAIYFPLIFEEYDDAHVVLTHRSPLAAVPSLCRMMETVAVALCVDGSLDKHRFGGFVQRLAEQCMFVPLKYREAHPERSSQIFDCLYEDLVADPIALVRRIYYRFGLEYTSEFESRMQRYLKNDRRGAYARSAYTLEEYGLDAKDIERRYAEYVASYNARSRQ